MPINENLDVGVDLSNIEELAQQFPQYPIDGDIHGMRADAREALLGALHKLRITAVTQSLDIDPAIVQQFLSIEEEFDVRARVEQRLKAGVSWLRLAELNLFQGKTKESTKMIIYRFPDSTESPLSSRIAVTG